MNRRLGVVPTLWLMAFGAILAYAILGASHAHATVEKDRLDIPGVVRCG